MLERSVLERSVLERSVLERSMRAAAGRVAALPRSRRFLGRRVIPSGLRL
jgi:hypothetical protein